MYFYSHAIFLLKICSLMPMFIDALTANFLMKISIFKVGFLRQWYILAPDQPYSVNKIFSIELSRRLNSCKRKRVLFQFQFLCLFDLLNMVQNSRPYAKIQLSSRLTLQNHILSIYWKGGSLTILKSCLMPYLRGMCSLPQ